LLPFQRVVDVAGKHSSHVRRLVADEAGLLIRFGTSDGGTTPCPN
jgi:hypothetical protein